MVHRKLAALAAVTTILMLVPTAAFAQDATPVSSLTALSGTILVLTFLLGVLSNSTTTGQFLGQRDIPKATIPYLTFGAAFIAGALPVLKTASAFSATVDFNAVMTGFFNILTAAGGAAAHAHLMSHQGPGGGDDVAAKKMAAARKAATVPPPAMQRLAFLAVLLVALVFGCTAAQVKANDAVAIDLTNSICSVAADTPVGQPFTDIICTIAESTEQGIGLLADGTPSATALASAAPTIKTVRIRVATSQAAAFLAQHQAPAAAGH